MLCMPKSNTSTTFKTMIDTTTLNQDSVDQELSLEDLASYNGGAVPILPALVLGGIGYLVYKGAKKILKELETVDQNLDSCGSCDSDGSNKTSYIDGFKDEEDPFNGAITGKS